MITDFDSGTATAIPYTAVKQLTGYNLSSNTRVAVGVTIVIAIAIAIILLARTVKT
ncbi:MAG: hypothetical protein HY232_12340 [Acidobacteria bacterium]|nr:hypothetical protein [Acidobacteriota bacterium]